MRDLETTSLKLCKVGCRLNDSLAIKNKNYLRLYIHPQGYQNRLNY